MDLELLQQSLAERGEPAFRARQVWAWAARGAAGYEQMTDLPAALRGELADTLPFSSLALREQAQSADGTLKALFATADERPLEAVLMRYRGRPAGGSGRRSVCVSSQSGCPLTCSFCATGAMRFARNLTTSEILDQVLHFRRIEAIDHCVFMGMGEPMMNLDAVLGACERLPEVGVTHRRTTISTVGWMPGIERLADCGMPIRLALSLHAADDALRSELMPVNERYPIAEVIDACRAFYARRRRRIFIEYVMLAGVNDRYEQALALARLLGGDRQARAAGPAAGRSGADIFKVNLIPYNPSGSGFEGSGREAIAAFRAALLEHGVDATVRLTRGRDIAAACGQLAAQGTRPGAAAPGR